MAQRMMPKWLTRLLKAIKDGLSDANIVVRVDAERVKGTRLHRVYVIGDKLSALRPSERQNLVWRVAEQVLTPEEQLRISMIMTLTPEEAGYEKRKPRVRRVRRAKSA